MMIEDNADVPVGWLEPIASQHTKNVRSLSTHAGQIDRLHSPPRKNVQNPIQRQYLLLFFCLTLNFFYARFRRRENNEY